MCHFRVSLDLCPFSILHILFNFDFQHFSFDFLVFTLSLSFPTTYYKSSLQLTPALLSSLILLFGSLQNLSLAYQIPFSKWYETLNKNGIDSQCFYLKVQNSSQFFSFSPFFFFFLINNFYTQIPNGPTRCMNNAVSY